MEYRRRLDRISRFVPPRSGNSASTSWDTGPRGFLSSIWQQKEHRDSLALTKVLTSHEGALTIDSPQGFLLHGEVGTGKSMMIDLLAESLPNRKKRRLHYNTFMLEAISRLEQLRKSREAGTAAELDVSAEDYSIMWLARDFVERSPILFLDEFQLPDRAASKIISNLFTSFFQLGGVLIATSNRMPEELDKAAGIPMAPPPSRFTSWASRLGAITSTTQRGKSENMFAGRGEFAAFLEILKARCEVWEMDSRTDYRRGHRQITRSEELPSSEWSMAGVREATPLFPASIATPEKSDNFQGTEDLRESPDYYFVTPTTASGDAEAKASSPRELYEAAVCSATGVNSLTNVPWEPARLLVYGRPVVVPRVYQGVALYTFAELCGSTLGPADYITLASNFHTFVVADVPVLTTLLKNEARRFISLLDALYEARCKLIVSAAATPDTLFFPDLVESTDAKNGENGGESEGGVYAEVFSEAYQDANAPFRPNVSSYVDSPDTSTLVEPNTQPAGELATLPPDALEDDPPNRARRMSFSLDDRGNEQDILERRPLDFGRTSAFVGEDERFAYKRATSRLWEMCGNFWWSRTGNGWWRPLPVEQRHWEKAVPDRSQPSEPIKPSQDSHLPLAGSDSQGKSQDMSSEQEEKFRHGASPFRRHSQPPPRIEWTHIWGMVKWGKRAGVWGQGVEGLDEARDKKDGKK